MVNFDPRPYQVMMVAAVMRKGLDDADDVASMISLLC